jgi:DNA-binding transcriptional regulator YdaS (Cro superfamily)
VNTSVGVFLTMSPLQSAIELAGGQSALAARVTELMQLPQEKRIKQQDIWRWLNRADGRVPPEYCVATAQAIEFKKTPHDLRPDIYPHPEDGLPPAMREQARAAE